MHWLKLLACAVLASELFLRLPILPTMNRARAAAMKAAGLLASRRISDRWKERMLPVYARIIATNSMLFLALLCAALLPVLIAGLLHPQGPGAWFDLLLRPLDMAVLLVASLAYVALRLRLRRG